MTTSSEITQEGAGQSPRLAVEPLPPDALNLNVAGREVHGPGDGFGRLWRKTYRVRLAGANVSPERVIEEWKAHFDEFWPPGNRFYAPITGIKPGEAALINLEIPGGGTLSTGVAVLEVTPRSFTLATAQGHMFSGWIVFSADDRDGATAAQAEIEMRASDPLYEFGVEFGGHLHENEFWTHTLSALAAHFGVRAPVESRVECLDFHRQWSRATNLWYNAAVRTMIHQAISPFRRLIRRDDSADHGDSSSDGR